MSTLLRVREEAISAPAEFGFRIHWIRRLQSSDGYECVASLDLFDRMPMRAYSLVLNANMEIAYHTYTHPIHQEIEKAFKEQVPEKELEWFREQVLLERMK